MKAAFLVARWLILGALAAASHQAYAADGQSNGQSSGARRAGKQAVRKASVKGRAGKQDSLSRDVVFDGSTINGRYLSAGEAISTVEKEKQMNELIGVRANFNDRLQAERSRLGSR